MRVLIACERSGVVREAFRAAGHTAFSCDFVPADDGSEWHHTGDVLAFAARESFDMMIAHPPCQYLSISGLHWNKRRPERAAHTEAALRFVRRLMALPVPRMCIENPVGLIGTRIRPADQWIQPYHFGDDASKRTGLWLVRLPRLKPTKFCPPNYGCKCGHRFAYALGKYGCPNCNGDNGAAKEIWSNQTPSGQNNLGPSPDRARLRAVTYPGIARAMATQWGALKPHTHNGDMTT